MQTSVRNDNVISLERFQGNGLPTFDATRLLGAVDTSDMVEGLFALLEGTPGVSIVTNLDGGILYMNARGREMIGIELPATGSATPDITSCYTPASARDLRVRAIPRAIRDGRWCGDATMLNYAGLSVPVTQVVIHQQCSTGQDVLICVAWDMRRQKLRENFLRHRATHDHLTGLPNRALIIDRLEQALNSAIRDGASGAVAFLDVDRFKEINDEFGHEAGDRLLQQIAGRICETLRAADTVGRYGGDEFVIVLPVIAEPANADMIIRRVMAAFAEPFDLGGSAVSVTASIGVATFPEDGREAARLLDVADHRMYERKPRADCRVDASRRPA